MTPRSLALSSLVASLVVSTLAPRAARAEPLAEDFADITDNYGKSARGLYESIQQLAEASDGDSSAAYGPISQHYSGLKQWYVADVWNARASATSRGLKEYLEALRSEFGQLNAQAGADNTAYVAGRKGFQACLQPFFDFDQNAQREFDALGRTFSKKLAEPYPKTANRTYVAALEDREVRRHAQSVGDYLGKDWEKTIADCCRNNLGDVEAKGGGPFCNRFNPNSEKLSSARDKLQSALSALGNELNPVDPLLTSKLKPDEVAGLLQMSDVRQSLRTAREKPGQKTGHGGNQDGERDDERDLSAGETDQWDKLSNDCRDSQRRRQKKTHPLANGGVLNTLTRTLKCTVLPFLSSQFLDTAYHQAAVGITAIPLEDKSENWDLNCDPKEVAMWQQTRPTDPNVVFANWGLPQLQNPPYIQSLRSLAPIQSPFPMVPMPGGGMLTPYGQIGGQALTGVQASSALAASGSINGGRRIAASRGNVVSRGLTVATTNGVRLTPSRRGIVQGQSLVAGVRTLSAGIRQGQAVAQGTASLRSGAARTRAFAQTMVKNNARRGLTAVAKDRQTSAATARTISRGLATVRASRTTGSAILNSIQGRTTVRTSAPTPTMGQVGDVGAAQARIDALVQQYSANIDSARTKAEAVRVNIAKMLAERDAAMAKAMSEIVDKPVAKQSKIMSKLRTVLMGIDQQLAGEKAQYDIFASSVNNQYSAMQMLARFGAGGDTGLGTLPTNTEAVPGFPTLPAGSAAGTAGGTRNTFYRAVPSWLILLPEAIAAPSRFGEWASAGEWRKNFANFVGSYRKFVDDKAAEEKQLLVKGAQAWRSMQQSVTEDSAQDSDTETLTTMELFAGSLREESSDLLEREKAHRLSLGNDITGELRKVQEDAISTQDALDQLALQYRSTYPRNVDDNPEVWWGLLPEMLIY